MTPDWRHGRANRLHWREESSFLPDGTDCEIVMIGYD